MARPKVLLTNPTVPVGENLIREIADIVVAPDPKPDTLRPKPDTLRPRDPSDSTKPKVRPDTLRRR